ncbi:metallophosphoesterase [Cuneatibacter caecimuris]|uniref:Calcineurin-like phosphoesterase domain-containing protein n=1 Tax=Cuneatibacter caecimuris TaxID=1796618 RepID=A0A4Q7PMH0_9FIRM|nr:metallophosphoesterase [Cuneatibacter caecimuris]RZT02092.1 hypothetical protein EV209_0197 [Cuneatibacter caecimuris]
MALLIVIPLYILLNAYVLWRCMAWLRSMTRDFSTRVFPAIFITVYVILAGSMLIAFFLPSGTPLKRFTKLLSNYWLGCQMYMLMAIFIADVLRLALKRTRVLKEEFFSSRKTLNITGTVLMAALIIVTVLGTQHVKNIKETTYEVSIDKTCDLGKNLKIALVADWHLGYNIGEGQMRRMVEKINAADVDLVCVAGDMFDNEYEAVPDPERIIQVLKSIRSTYGVYACWGNHDVAESILGGFTVSKKERKMSDPRMEEFLEKAGIHLLQDEVVCVNNSLYLAGRLDYAKPGRKAEVRKTPQELTEGLDLSKPVIVIDHEPRELQELADAGVDMDLSGHTHDGQMFPGNLTIDLFWENACGYLKKDNMHSVVTSGIGLWGPNMRIGTDSEVVFINVSFR